MRLTLVSTLISVLTSILVVSSSAPAQDTAATPGESLSGSSVTDTFRENLPQLQRCYLIASQKNKSIKIRVEVGFEVAPDGHVITSKVEKSDRQDGLFDSCLIDAVRSWSFAPPAGGTAVKVTYPLLFEPGNISMEGSKKSGATAKKKKPAAHKAQAKPKAATKSEMDASWDALKPTPAPSATPSMPSAAPQSMPSDKTPVTPPGAAGK